MNEPSVFNGPEVSMHRDMIHDKYVHKISPKLILTLISRRNFTLTHILPLPPILVAGNIVQCIRFME